MPEGDTVHRTARLLDRGLSRRVLTATDFRVPTLATTDLRGWRVQQTLARGKHLLTRLVGPDPAPRARSAPAPVSTGTGPDAPVRTVSWTLHTHLQMDGTWQVLRPGERWRRPGHTARCVLTTEAAVAVGFSLPVLELLPTAEEDRVVGHLGPDLLGEDWDPDRAVANLRADPDRPLRLALLDQRNLAGLGNEYVCELCFVQGVHPRRPVGGVADVARLVQRAQQMLRSNLDRRVRTITGDTRRGQRQWVYGREHQPCRRCGTPVAAETVAEPGHAGEGRTSYWCPRCQPESAGH